MVANYKVLSTTINQNSIHFINCFAQLLIHTCKWDIMKIIALKTQSI